MSWVLRTRFRDYHILENDEARCGATVREFPNIDSARRFLRAFQDDYFAISCLRRMMAERWRYSDIRHDNDRKLFELAAWKLATGQLKIAHEPALRITRRGMGRSTLPVEAEEPPAEPVREERPLVRDVVLLRIRILRGRYWRRSRCKLIIDENSNQKELFQVGPIIITGDLNVVVPEDVAKKAGSARLYYLNNQNKETGEGLLLDLGQQTDDIEKKESAASRALRALGFYRREPVGDGTPKGQSRLDLDLAIARYQRTWGLTAEPFGVTDTRRSLAETYWGYDYQPTRLPVTEFPTTPIDLVEVVRLKFWRGTTARSGDCRVVCEDSAGGELWTASRTSISANGELSIEIPKSQAGKARLARLYYLDRSGQETGEGLLLELGQQPDDIQEKESATSRALRALGFYRREPVADGTPEGQARLDLDLAIARYQRTRGLTASPFSENAICRMLQTDYWNYGYKPIILPNTEATAKQQDITEVTRLKLIRGTRARAGKCRVIVEDDSGNVLWTTSSKAIDRDGHLVTELPRSKAERARVARLYYLDTTGEETGEGLLIEFNHSISDMESRESAASHALRALGYYRREPVADGIPEGQARLDLDLAIARLQRNRNIPDLVPFLANNASLKELKTYYCNYEYMPYELLIESAQKPLG